MPGSKEQLDAAAKGIQAHHVQDEMIPVGVQEGWGQQPIVFLAGQDILWPKNKFLLKSRVDEPAIRENARDTNEQQVAYGCRSAHGATGTSLLLHNFRHLAPE